LYRAVRAIASRSRAALGWTSEGIELPLSPEEIETKRFVTMLRGYDPEEVEGFLGQVGAEMRLLLQALYAALPPAGADPTATASLSDLLDHGKQVTAEVARLAENGRLAQIDADALRRAAKDEVAELHAAATQYRLQAVRDALGIMDKARQEARAILAAALTRRDEVRVELQRVQRELEGASSILETLRRRIDETMPTFSEGAEASKVER
jgi:DivIVA domain-containing protein